MNALELVLKSQPWLRARLEHTECMEEDVE